MKALSQQFDKNGSSMQSNRQKVELLNKAISANRDKLMEQRHMLDEATKKYGEADTKTLKWKQTVAETEAELARLEGELKQIPNALQQVGDRMQQVGDKMANIGKTMTTHLTLPIVALGTAAVKVAADFESGMDKVAAISGATGSDLEKLTAKAREMGETSIYSATEAASALEFMAMAGWKTEDMLNGIEGVMDLAAASGADLATTSDIVTDSLTAFGESAEEAGRLADIMAAASANANTNVEMMGETFKYAAPIAGTLGVSMEDMAFATGLMANAGVKATSAGTALRAGLTRLAAPPKAAAEALKKYNIVTTDSEGNMLSLREIMETVREKLGDLSESEQAAALNAIFGKNAISGWAAILNASESDFTRLTAAIDGSSGAAKSMAETMKDNLKGELTMLKSQLESIGIEFGEIIMPTIKDIVKGIGNVVKRLKKLSPETKDLIVKLGMFVAAAGPVMAIGGKFISGIGKIVKGIGGFVKAIPQVIANLTMQTTATEIATGAQLGLNAAMYAMPIIGLIAGIGALIGAIVSMDNASKEAAKELNGVTQIGDNIRASSDDIVSSVNEYREAMKGAGAESRATAMQAENAAESLLEISKSGDTSETSMAKMRVAVAQLNKLFPEMGLEIDSTTGKLNKSESEIRSFVNESKKMAAIETATSKAQISMDHVAEATQNVVNAQYNLDAAMAKKDWLETHLDGMLKLSQAYSDGELTLDEYNQKIHELDEAMTVTETGQISWNGAVQYADSLMQGWKVSLEAIDDEINTATGVLSAANQELELTNSQAERYQESLDQLKAAEEATTEATRSQGEAVQASILNVDQAIVAWDSLSEHQQNMALKAVEAMTTLQSNVESALSSQMNMFEEFKGGSAMATDQLLANMKSQIDGVTNWEQNLKSLADRGINQDLLQTLAAMGPQGASYVDTFNQMTADQLRMAGRYWKQGLNIQGFGNEEALELQTAIGSMSVGSEAGFLQLGESMGIQAKGATENVAQGMINGLETLKGAVEASGTEMGDGLIESINTALGVHSPSTITTQSGKDVDQGLGNGLIQGNYFILAACSQVKATMNSSLLTPLGTMATQAQTGGQRIGQGVANGINSARGSVSSAITGITSVIQQGQSQMQAQIPQWQNIGQMLCAGMAAGIAAGQSQVINAVASVVAAAVATAMAQLQINSPSKVGDKLIGRNFDAGIAQGIEYNIPLIQKSVKDATAAMIQPVAPQSYAMASGAGGYNQISNDFGGTVINVYGADGQSAEELADIVIDRMNDQYMRMSATWGR